MGFIFNDRRQQKLLGYCLSDFVANNDKSHMVVDIVSKLDLTELYNRYSNQGNDAYDPKTLLATWFFAYSEGESSTRKIENLCRYELRFIYVSADLHPDHTTLSRFRKRHLDLMADYFVQILLLAKEAGISDFKEISIDGTKIKASCSKKQSHKEDQLNRKIEAIHRDIAEYMSRCDLAEEEDDIEDLESIRKKIEKLKKKEKELVECKARLKERKEELKPEHRKNHQINIIEPEARFMPKSDGPSYNAQAAVDSMTNFIVANDVVTDPNDQNQFSKMHQKSEKNLGGDSQRKYDADSGFHSLEQLEYVNEEGIDAVIADPTPKNRSNNSSPTNMESILQEGCKVERSDFIYHCGEDYYECPAGKKLNPLYNYKRGKSHGKIYQCLNCSDCPLIDQCLGGSSKTKLRRLYRDDREILAEKMNNKLQTDEAKSRLKLRATSVEPVFGNIKQNLGFRRFSLRGLGQVKGEFNLMSIAHNLNTLFNLIAKDRFRFIIFVQYYQNYCQILWVNLELILIIQVFIKNIYVRHRIYKPVP
jgi:transposase